MANALSQNLDYTDKDFDAILARLQNLVPSVFPTWTDFNKANFGNILLQAFSFVLDVLTVYQDNQSGEARIVTATQRKNIIALAKLINFEADGAIAAQFVQTFSIPSAVAGNVVIEAGTIVRTPEIVEPVEFQVLNDVTIVAGATSASGTVENSATHQDQFTSDDTPNQEFKLSSVPYLDNSAGVVAGDGTYVEVSDFLSSLPTDKHFTISVDQSDRATIRFGNGTNGKIPTGTITVTFKTGGGESGNVDPGKISNISGAFSDSFGTPVTISTTNASSAAIAGEDRQSVEQIRALAPASLRVLNRAVAREDFEIVARAVAGVSRALHLTSNEDAVQENTGILYIIPTGGGTPSDALKDLVAAQFAKNGPYPSTVTFTLIVQDPVYLTVNIAATVYKQEGFTAAQVGANVRAELEAFFAAEDENGTVNEAIDFGFNFKDSDGNPAGEISWSDVFNVVRDTSGVRKVGANSFLLNSLQDDLSIANREFPKLGTVTLIDGDTGASL